MHMTTLYKCKTENCLSFHHLVLSAWETFAEVEWHVLWSIWACPPHTPPLCLLLITPQESLKSASHDINSRAFLGKPLSGKLWRKHVAQERATVTGGWMLRGALCFCPGARACVCRGICWLLHVIMIWVAVLWVHSRSFHLLKNVSLIKLCKKKVYIHTLLTVAYIHDMNSLLCTKKPFWQALTQLIEKLSCCIVLWKHITEHLMSVFKGNKSILKARDLIITIRNKTNKIWFEMSWSFMIHSIDGHF